MKKLALIFLIPFLIVAQNNETKSLLELKSSASLIPIEVEEFGQDEYKSRKKSVALAMLYSALLPGMGELYAGDYGFGKFLTIADAFLWGTYIGVNSYASSMEDNYKSYATSMGSANVESKDDKYFADIGNYLDVYEYNHLKDLERNFHEVYNEETHYWKWSGVAQRSEYREMWKSSETANNTTRFIVGALILNRVASIINAIRLVNAHNKNLKKELEVKNKIKVLVLCFDVQKKDDVIKALESLDEKWKKIDVLVNNAGLALDLKPIQDGDFNDWDTMIDTNIKGLLYMSKLVSNLMIQNGSGHIINIGSIAGKEAYPNGNVYSATKHAIEGLTKAMRLDLFRFGIKVSQIAPGAVETEFSEVRFHGDKETAEKVYKGYTPLTAEDVAESIYFVASQPTHVNINDLLIMPMAQANATTFNKK